MQKKSSRHVLTAIRQTAGHLEKEWGMRPIIILACMGGQDEHWQFFDPRIIRSMDEEHMPFCTVDRNGKREFHP